MTAVVEGLTAMLGEHWFWGSLTLAVLLWYSSVTIYVSVKGTGDIRRMLKRLEDAQHSTHDRPGPPSPW
jgi:hypothetical protein